MIKNQTIQVAFLCFLLVGVLTLFIVQNYRSQPTFDTSVSNELDWCFHVYLDVGSNVGVQVRKLFQPELYKDAGVIKYFQQYFGQAEDGMWKNIGQGGDRMWENDLVCAVGFEPNPHHTQTLQSVEKAYSQCGWRAHFYTETAVSNVYGKADFMSDGDIGNNEWGGGIVANAAAKGEKKAGIVQKVRLADYILERVATRKIPNLKNRKPKVLMKVDIEGSELEVLTDLLVSGALQHIDLAFVEFHPHLFNASDPHNQQIDQLAKISQFLTELTTKENFLSKVNINTADDETYHTSKFDLPKCDSSK